MKKISVAMSSYNHAPYVAYAIESVLSQDVDLEFTIVDDGSKDETAAIISKYKDPRISFQPLPKNEGACVALRKAIEMGSGEYVAIINSDDAFLPGKLKEQQDFLDQNPNIAAVFGFAEFIDEKGNIIQNDKLSFGSIFEKTNRSRFEWLNFFFFSGNALCHPSVMIRRSCYKELGYYDPRLMQLPDYDFWIKLLLKHEIHVMQKKIIQFRMLPHERNTSAPSFAVIQRQQWETLQILNNYLTISTLDEYFSIFPEDRKIYSTVTEKEMPYIIPFALANKALTHSFHSSIQPSYKLFALQKLYDLMQIKEVYSNLAPRFGITLANFCKLPSQHRIFKYPWHFAITQYLKKYAVMRAANHAIKKTIHLIKRK
ncbi:MAG: hypothetical protein BGO10_06170 [Chlamydia sp. 32-24]|nr:MAG: hypothetical protein BGO10_06170 [Chlamydia sp. 32-24]